LQEGDRNTKFFHECANQKRTASSIYKVVDADGGVCEEQGTIAQAFICYYVCLFTTVARTNTANCLMSLLPCITTEMNEYLLQPYTVEEVSIALNQIDPLKASETKWIFCQFFPKALGALWAQRLVEL
jgi:hypothetical protein